MNSQKIRWHFRPKQPGEPNREPIHGEFFASDAISGPGRALVREAIQNALDAGQSKAPVFVRIYIPDSPSDTNVVRQNGDGLLSADAWKHFQAKKNGLSSDGIPSPGSPCRFIVFEDFETTGLEGDTKEAFEPRENHKNRFYHFFRAEGQSDKEAPDRGRWGVGKAVFFRASQISTIFGLTVRKEDKRKLLMGKSVLKSHYVDNDQGYYQDGYFGIPSPDKEHFVLPIEDHKILDDFEKCFDLQRGDAPGLSVVTLWPDPEIQEKEIISAVLQDYFYPILSGQLEVIVETPNVKTLLDKKSLLGEVERLNEPKISYLKPLIDLAQWSLSLSNEKHVIANHIHHGNTWKWSKELFTDERLKELKDGYFAGEKLAVRVPVNVCKRNDEVEESFFCIYLARNSTKQQFPPVFIREGIIISEVKSSRVRDICAIVVAPGGPLAAFLRMAENPSHTQWHHSRLKEEYKHGYKTNLQFVEKSVYHLVQTVTGAEKKEDRTLLEDIFSIPEGDDSDDKKNKKSGTKKINVANHPQKFRIQNVQGGFSILPSKDTLSPSDSLDIRVAYDRRRGNPIKRYNSEDFDVGKKPVAFVPEPKNATVVKREKNHIVVKIEDSDFAVSVIGFDKRRQLYVKVDVASSEEDK